MDNALMETALAAALEAVLESMFFIDTSGRGPGPEDVEEDSAAARLEFEGQPCGSLTLRVSRPAAQSIAADFLAQDEASLSDRQVGDVICELTNMICGAALSKLEKDICFRLHAPILLSSKDDTDRGERVARSLDVGSGIVSAVLRFDDEHGHA